MLNRSQALSHDSFRRMHREEIRSPERIREILQRLMQEERILQRALNRHIEAECAYIERVQADALVLRTRNFDRRHGSQLFLNTTLDDQRLFFHVRPIESRAAGRLTVAFPTAVFVAERRGVDRSSVGETLQASAQVKAPDGSSSEALIADSSEYGIGLELPTTGRWSSPGSALVVQLHRANGTDRVVHGEVRHASPSRTRSGWMRLGIALTDGPPRPRIPVERRKAILDQPSGQKAWQRITVASAGVRLASQKLTSRITRQARKPAKVPLIDYANDKGENIRAIVDAWGDTRGAVAVVVPPAFAKTKETLLPLAWTIRETFRRSGHPVVVLRYDGIRRRGESHQDEDCRLPGREFLKYTFSQGVHDIRATLDFLSESADFKPRATVLVTFSAAAVEGRRAVAEDATRRRVSGWVSVVGAPDLQESLRTVSGGIDFATGIQRGISFGQREVLGAVFDMDYTGRDVLDNNLGTLVDARRDMEKIRVPVTWIHGRYDAWMDLERVREVVSSGDTHNRRLIEIPTGHQLRTSSEAFEAFGLIAAEVARIALNEDVKPAYPDLVLLAQRASAERARLPRPDVDLKNFWKDYLLGRSRKIGIDFVTQTTAYQTMMRRQLELLALRPNDRIADLGAGTGALLDALNHVDHPPVAVDQFDYVADGLDRARERHPGVGGVALRQVVADLDQIGGIPALSGSYDAAVASLLLSYLKRPADLVGEAFRVLRPGGRFVASTLRKDADFSRIYVEELNEARARAIFGDEIADSLDELAHSFMNDAARLLDLEERGWFRFWDPEELCVLLKRVGFRQVRAARSFGDPPQAIIVSGRRP